MLAFLVLHHDTHELCYIRTEMPNCIAAIIPVIFRSFSWNETGDRAQKNDLWPDRMKQDLTFYCFDFINLTLCEMMHGEFSHSFVRDSHHRHTASNHKNRRVATSGFVLTSSDFLMFVAALECKIQIYNLLPNLGRFTCTLRVIDSINYWIK